jgi:hypothetical protein
VNLEDALAEEKKLTGIMEVSNSSNRLEFKKQ